jgi:hypothetical protein
MNIFVKDVFIPLCVAGCAAAAAGVYAKLNWPSGSEKVRDDSVCLLGFPFTDNGRDVTYIIDFDGKAYTGLSSLLSTRDGQDSSLGFYDATFMFGDLTASEWFQDSGHVLKVSTSVSSVSDGSTVTSAAYEVGDSGVWTFSAASVDGGDMVVSHVPCFSVYVSGGSL